MRRALPWLAFAGLTACLLVRIGDGDPWFHLVIGREILRSHAIPAIEFYKWPLLGRPATYHEWGFGVLLALAERGGWWTLAAANAALGAGALTLIAAAAVRRGASWTAAILLLGPAAAVASERFAYRPESALYLAFGLAVYALERGWWPALPALTAGLALFHPSPLIVLLVAACYLADEAARARDRRLAVAVGWTVLAALAVGIVPYGYHQLTLPIAFALQGDLTRTIAEFVPSLSSSLWWQVVAVAACGLAGVVVTRRPADLLMVLGFGLLGFSAVRNIPLFALAAFGPAAAALSRVRIPRVIPAIGAVAAAALFFRSPGWGAGPGLVPVRAASFIEQYRVPGRIVNPIHLGGYLAWRGLAPSSDGRAYQGTDDSMRLSDRVLHGEAGWQDIVDRDGLTMVVTGALEPSFGHVVPIVPRLWSDPEWLLALTERSGLLFVRRDAFPAGAQPRQKDEAWAQVLKEATEQARTYGRAAPAAERSRGLALLKLGDFQGAAAALAVYTAAVPDDPEAGEVLSVLRAAERGDAAARQIVEQLWAGGRAEPVAGTGR